MIREISWRWREIGADSRICDLINSQVSAIEASCAQISLADPHPGLQAAFALIDRAVAAFDENKEAEPEALAEASDEAAGAETAWSAGECGEGRRERRRTAGRNKIVCRDGFC